MTNAWMLASRLQCGLLAALLGSTGAAAAHDTQQLANRAVEQPAYARSVQELRVPAVSLLDQHGKRVRLDQLIAAQPVLLQFVFTSCATVCPVQAAVFSTAQPALDRLGQPYRMISISIDPEQDSTSQLQQFAAKFKAGPQWRFLTGAPHDIARVLKAFGAALPANNKMFHQPYTFLYGGRGRPWVKLDGMLSLAELEAECSAAFGLKREQAPVLASRVQPN